MQLNSCACVHGIGMYVVVKSHSVLVKHLRLTPSHEDFELKKLLINELVLLTRDPTVLPVSLLCLILLSITFYTGYLS